MNERDRAAADDWMRDHLPDPDEFGKTEKPDQKAKPSNSKTDSETAVEEPKEKKRRGRAPTEGELLKRVLIFLSESDVAALKAEVGDRAMSTRIREILKEYLAKRA